MKIIAGDKESKLIFEENSALFSALHYLKLILNFHYLLNVKKLFVNVLHID
jgi:hypothetical protein